jgi:hypothetical protein
MSVPTVSPERSRVLVSVRVPCQSTEAWDRFTAEIGQWWRPNQLFAFSQGRSGTLAFEPTVGGWLTETYPDGSLFVIGVISVWEPPRRLVVSWRQASFPPDVSTELHVHFEPGPQRPASASSTTAGTASLPSTPPATVSPSAPSSSASPSGGARSSPPHSLRATPTQPESRSGERRPRQSQTTSGCEGHSHTMGSTSRGCNRSVLSCRRAAPSCDRPMNAAERFLAAS